MFGQILETLQFISPLQYFSLLNSPCLHWFPFGFIQFGVQNMENDLRKVFFMMKKFAWKNSNIWPEFLFMFLRLIHFGDHPKDESRFPAQVDSEIWWKNIIFHDEIYFAQKLKIWCKMFEHKSSPIEVLSLLFDFLLSPAVRTSVCGINLWSTTFALHC